MTFTITIAIPIYNNVQTVSSAIESAINQKFEQPYQIILVDNASDDGSSKILEEYSKTCKIHRHDNTIPIWANHNSCLRFSKTDYTLILHADDTLDTHALTNLTNTLMRCNEPDNTIIWGRSTFYDYYYHLKRENVKLNSIFEGKKAKEVFKFGGLTSSGTLYPKKFFEIGAFLEMESSYMPSDLFSMLKAADYNLAFMMCDENVLIRSQSSTLDAASLTQKNYQKYIYDAFRIYYDQLGYNKQKDLIAGQFFNPIDAIPNYMATYLHRAETLKFYLYFLKNAFNHPIRTLKFLKRWVNM